jgi:murein L,D-transpeptidase YcbB/YkuD
MFLPPAKGNVRKSKVRESQAVVSSRRVLALFAVASISFTLSWGSFAERRDALAAPVGEAVTAAIRARLSEKPFTDREQKAVLDYYSRPEVPLLWVDENGLSPRAKNVVEEIAKADDYGLRSSDYDLPKPDGFDANTAAATGWLADAEIKITLAVLRYARDARGGRLNPTRLSANLNPTMVLPEPRLVLESIATHDPAVYLRMLHPTHPQFKALQKKLIELRRAKANDAHVATIRLILLNMERWRWLPSDLGSFYVVVNVPEFILRVIANGEQSLTARVVVGRPDTQTPIFSNKMQEIVFNPYWNMPNSIKSREIQPSTQRPTGWFSGGGWDTSVFKRHNLRVSIQGREVDPAKIDWKGVDIGTLDIYQPPGPSNVLGRVKFMFPNKHDVYMHDTPMRFAFDEPIRAESHGCVRVENPDQLALLILRRDQGWSQAKTASAIKHGYDQHVALKQKIPVHITYFTLRVNEDGSISTFADLYGHDARMEAALFGEHLALVSQPKRERSQRKRAQDDPSHTGAESLSGFVSNF